MVSSRNNSDFHNRPLTEIRAELKDLIESERLFDKDMFEVWINETEFPQSFDTTIWNACLEQVRKADIIIVLYNGEAGWLRPKDSIGICHAEVLEAANVARGKVWSITLENETKETVDAKERKANKKFEAFMKEQELFTKPVTTIEDLTSSVEKALCDAMINLTLRGVREASRDKGNHGESLRWKNMNYDSRSRAIITALKESIEVSGTGSNNNENYFLEFGVYKILVTIHAVPDTLSIASAREKVGQPFLQDFKRSDLLLEEDNIIGPIHVIGCNKSVSETQTRNILGFPDATILKDSFGIYVADNIQKIQMVFIQNCSDSHSIRHGFQDFFEWLSRTSEEKNLIQRAKSRKNIINAIAQENKNR